MEQRKQFEIGHQLHLPIYMTDIYAGRDFYYTGNYELHKKLVQIGQERGLHMDGCTIPVKARVVGYHEFVPDKNCFKISVKWYNPFEFDRLILNKNGDDWMTYHMLESEFSEFAHKAPEPIYKDSFVVGDWVYYLGAKGGGADTTVWKEGFVGQIFNVCTSNYHFKSDNCGTKSNLKRAFRLATTAEITVEKGRIGRSDLLNGFAKSTTDVSRYILDHSGSPVHESVLFAKPLVNIDETQVSFQSKLLVANKINNSKEIENFLLTS